MNSDAVLQFNLDNYPKSFGSIDGWRLHEYLHLPVEEQERAYKHLEHFCLHRAKHCPAVHEHNGYTLLGSGWEWSVFAKNDSTVIKIPSGIFPEVNTPQYLTNAQNAYELLKQYFPEDMVAETKFYRHNNLNIIEQTRMQGNDWNVVALDQANDWMLQKLIIFFTGTAQLIKEQQWLPDFWLDYDPAGFALRNIMINQANNQFAIIDFTSYLDPARMYPALRDHHCHKNAGRIQDMLSNITAALGE